MAWSQAPSPCRRRKRGRQNHPATASRRGSGRTPPGLETERRTPPATLADRFSICSPLEHNGNIWPAVNRSQAGPATTIGGAGANGRSLGGRVVSKNSSELILCSLPADARDAHMEHFKLRKIDASSSPIPADI